MLNSVTIRNIEEGLVTISIEKEGCPSSFFSIVVTIGQNGVGSISSTGIKAFCPHCDEDCHSGCSHYSEMISAASMTEASKIEEEAEDEALKLDFHNAAIEGMESLILAAACQGVDIGSAAFLKAIETALEAIGNEYD